MLELLDLEKLGGGEEIERVEGSGLGDIGLGRVAFRKYGWVSFKLYLL